MRKTYSVIYSTDALNDLRAIYSYIARQCKAPITAERQINRIRKVRVYAILKQTGVIDKRS